MAIIGWFGALTGRPYFDGRLVIPRLNVRRDITFAMDTGADNVVLSVSDTIDAKIDYAELIPAPELTLGVSGTAQDYTENALLMFADDEFEYYFDLSILISHFSPELSRLPSLLGREILDNWHITYRPSRNLLTAEVDFSNATVRRRPDTPTIRRNVGRD